MTNAAHPEIALLAHRVRRSNRKVYNGGLVISLRGSGSAIRGLSSDMRLLKSGRARPIKTRVKQARDGRPRRPQ